MQNVFISIIELHDDEGIYTDRLLKALIGDLGRVKAILSFLSLEFINIITIKSLCMIIASVCLLAMGAGNIYSIKNLENYNWKDCGGASWFLDPGKNHNESLLLRSGQIENVGISRICLDVRGPAKITFRWKTNANFCGVGRFAFLVNGDRKRVCDSKEWKYESYDLRDRINYSISWEFAKFKTYPKNFGTGWIDNISITTEIPRVLQNTSAVITDPNAIINPSTTIIIPSGNITIGSSNIIIGTPDIITSGQIADTYARRNSNRNVTHVDYRYDPYPYTYKSISEAINNTNEGGTVFVANALYKESIIIDRSIHLVGKDRYNTIIQATQQSDNVINVCTKGNVTIENFTITGGNIGVRLQGTTEGKLTNNIIRNFESYGVLLIDTKKQNVSYNTIEATGTKTLQALIKLENTNYCNLFNNTLRQNGFRYDVTGISLKNSNKSNIDNNNIANSNVAIKLYGDSGGNCIIETNNISDNSHEIFNSTCRRYPTYGQNIIFLGFKTC